LQAITILNVGVVDVPLGIHVIFLSRLAGPEESSLAMTGDALLQTKGVMIAQFRCAEEASSGGLKFLTVGSTPQSRDPGGLTLFVSAVEESAAIAWSGREYLLGLSPPQLR
jgi:hypothetical protein